jgi:2-keto-4-pentenoate hydratase/2-oxohepta-3-ene-1,7-dioic acid hydratase in catechol pathway
MRLCTIQRDGKAVVGSGDGKIIDSASRCSGTKSLEIRLAAKTQDEVLKACAKPKAGAVVSEVAKYMVPIAAPGKICIGLNYRKHAEETKTRSRLPGGFAASTTPCCRTTAGCRGPNSRTSSTGKPNWP